MITLDECIEMSGLTRDEIAAICEHEHIPEIAAAAFAYYKLHEATGVEELRAIIRDDIRAALERGDKAHAASLLETLRHFMELRTS